MQKAMTTEAAKGQFPAGVAAVPTPPLTKGRVSATRLVDGSGNAVSNKLQQHRNPSDKHFDAPEDRGSSIKASSGAAGMKATPTSRSGL